MTEPNLKTQESYFIVMDFRNKIKKLPHYRTKWSLNQIVGKTAMSEITN